MNISLHIIPTTLTFYKVILHVHREGTVSQFFLYMSYFLFYHFLKIIIYKFTKIYPFFIIKQKLRLKLKIWDTVPSIYMCSVHMVKMLILRAK